MQDEDDDEYEWIFQEYRKLTNQQKAGFEKSFKKFNAHNSS